MVGVTLSRVKELPVNYRSNAGTVAKRTAQRTAKT